MKVNGQAHHSIWMKEGETDRVYIIDQRPLPHEFKVLSLRTVEDCARAIKEMWVRGAPLIGATAAFGMYLATQAVERQNHSIAADVDAYYQRAAKILLKTRPTAVNLQWALKKQLHIIKQAVAVLETEQQYALRTALSIHAGDIATNHSIGKYGLDILKAISEKKKGDTIHILTHCNAGWLATVDYGTATAPIYLAHQAGIKVHVWVDETRPRNQGARITAWELGQEGIPHTVIADNVGGHLMQQGMVDICIVGTDRTTYKGDVANKIGTYLKALAAKDNGVPFYVALPSSTIDWEIANGKDIPIEQRSAEEVTHIQGLDKHGVLTQVRLTPANSKAVNYGFDVTPAHLVSGLITERGVCAASEEGIRQLFRPV